MHIIRAVLSVCHYLLTASFQKGILAFHHHLPIFSVFFQVRRVCHEVVLNIADSE